jgi:hypothetical protein
MNKRFAIAALSFLTIAAAQAKPAAAEQQPSCRENGSICTDGQQCCSKICTRPTVPGSSTCTAT